MEAVLAIQEFLEYTVVQLITHPEEASVIHEQRDDGSHLYLIRLHPDDTGRVIGKGGKTIQAIRSLAIASAQKNDLRVDVELEDDE